MKITERTRVLLLTTFDDDSFLDGGIAAGASGFLLKTTRPAEIAEAIRTIHAGGKVLSPDRPAASWTDTSKGSPPPPAPSRTWTCPTASSRCSASCARPARTTRSHAR